MSNEQWLEDGDCTKCRRGNYCSKPCKKSKERLQRRIKGAIEEATGLNKFYEVLNESLKVINE